jgi:hypothetical protein
VLCPNGTLEVVAKANPDTLEGLGQLPELRRWQLRTIGEALLTAIKDPAAVQPVPTGDGSLR